MDPEDDRSVKNVPMMPIFPKANVLSAMQYEPRTDDVIIVTYPKCGTTWTQYIVSHILTKAEPPKGPAEYMLCSPLIELLGAESATSTDRKGPLITHLPLNAMVFSRRAKYIYVTRNPYDCSVSCYYFFKGPTSRSTEDVSFGSFLERFHSGKTIYGDYFDHLLPWYKMRNEPNVLFFTYEQLKISTRELIFKIAHFLGEEHGTALNEDTQFYENILQSSSFKNMKAVFDYTPYDRIKALGELPPEKHLKSLEFCKKLNIQNKMYKGSAFVRKGMIGDWRDHYTTGYIAKTKAWIAEKTNGSDVMNLWKDLDLP
ncbi:sulfotransferase 2A8-like [Dermacentor andersoni]|uniref:sulfotransferase 2A8-like n=1 Tax=Dermacentor andersoni TaxID=34620 RepID=UPI0024176AA3|nr:sulfotransferase 2A8-like [Dermacentor andersoni]